MEASAAVPQLTFPKVAIVNDKTSGLADSEVHAMVSALDKALKSDFGPAWHTGAHLGFYGVGKKAPAGQWAIALLDSSDVAGALGYHDLTPDGYPLGKVFAGTDRQYGQIVSVTLAHELFEMLADPWINLTAQADDGRFFAWETSDAVEADRLAYDIDGVKISDFVTPHWFGHGNGPVDHCAAIQQPYELAPGGYISVFDPSSGRGWTQLQAQMLTVRPPEAPVTVAARGLGLVDAGVDPLDVVKALPKVGSRRERRFRGRHLWVPSTYEAE